MIVRLEEAVLCVDCEAITDSKGPVCDACGHGALLSLGRILGTIPPEDAAKVVTLDDARTLWEKLRDSARARRTV